MDQLMAGLDASMFENVVSSPIRPKSNKPSQRSPLQVKRESLFSPQSSSTRPGSKESFRIKVEHQPQAHVRTDDHPCPPTFMLVEDTPAAKKVEEWDDPGFLVDFDLGDLSAFDEDLELPSLPQNLYPIRNPSVPPRPAGYQPTPWSRCTVKFASDGLRFADGAIPPLEKLSLGSPSRLSGGKTIIVETPVETLRVVHLKERWADVRVCTGDTVNIISPNLSDPSRVIEVTLKDPSTFLILHPDLMITMTSIANSMPCPRKPILNTLVKVPGPSNKAMLYGNILHGLLQRALMEQGFDAAETRKRIDEELKKESTRLDIGSADLGIEDVRLEIGLRSEAGFESFGNKWACAEPQPTGELHAMSGESPSLLAINGLHEVEEDIWSPKWGLKGKVDASVQIKMVRDPSSKSVKVNEDVAPLEIKTGRAVGVMAHRAQTMLYTLLMEERYGIPIPAGLLYYSQLDTILRVEARPNEIRALIMARNELAHYLSVQRRTQTGTSGDDAPGDDHRFLPPTLDSPRECRTCYAVDSCMLYRKASGRIDADGDPIAELYFDKTGHLSDRHAAFFQKWESLLSVEEQDLNRFRSQLWTMTAKEREKSGRCYSDMIITGYSNHVGKSLAKIHRHSYTFTRAPYATQDDRTSMLSGHIAKGDPVSLSIEPDLLCLWRGFVTDLTTSSVTVGVTYMIDTEALLARTKHRGHQMAGDKVVFRIDKDEMASGILRMRSNLAQLFFADGDEKRRRLIVDMDTPRFAPDLAPLPEEVPSTLNQDQQRAMDKVLTAQDYALILGMPGTGKTTTIAEIIKALVERGKSVLLTSYTHSAVDTILMKLLNSDIRMLRLGNIDKVHPDVQHLTLEAMGDSASIMQMEERLMSPPVVGATCLSTDHPIFFRRKFDYCIVDEASQITLPTCLGPLRMADTFVLVGDHFQLPPIVKNAEARRGGLDVSLFKLLSDAHPEAVVDLSYQYRMNNDIMLLSNQLIYENRLKCGSEEVARQSLVVPMQRSCREINHDALCPNVQSSEQCWIQDLMRESVKAVFVNTDAVPARDKRVGDLVQNEVEANLVSQFAHSLATCGIKEEQMAVITPYRQQIKLLTGRLLDLPRIEILTADRSQGRDKDVVLISLVRSNEKGFIGDLLRDWRRINVSFTRAKKKLVIFGSRSTLEGDCLLKGFLDLMDSKGWIYRLPKQADAQHRLPKPSLFREEPKVGETAIKAQRQDKVSQVVLKSHPFARDALVGA